LKLPLNSTTVTPVATDPLSGSAAIEIVDLIGASIVPSNSPESVERGST
jgi:hypothetical protein